MGTSGGSNVAEYRYTHMWWTLVIGGTYRKYNIIKLNTGNPTTQLTLSPQQLFGSNSEVIARLWRTGLARRRRRCCCWWGYKIQTTIYSTWTLQGGQSIHLCVPKSTHVVVDWRFFFFYSIIIHFIFIKPKAIHCLTLLLLVTGRRTRRKKRRYAPNRVEDQKHHQFYYYKSSTGGGWGRRRRRIMSRRISVGASTCHAIEIRSRGGCGFKDGGASDHHHDLQCYNLV